MKIRKLFGLALVLFALSVPAFAQVEKVVADAEGITWASCAAVMEMALRRLDGVGQVVISIERQAFAVVYEPNSSFQPDELREAVGQAGVDVVQFHIQAEGKIQKQGEKLIFISGKDRYEIVDSPELPLNTVIRVGGDILDDSKRPYPLKVLDFKPKQ